MKHHLTAWTVSCGGAIAAIAAALEWGEALAVLAVVWTAACGWAGIVLAPHDRRVATVAVLAGAAISLAAQGVGWPVASTPGAGVLIVGASLVSLFGSILLLPSLRVNTTAFIAGATLVVTAMAGTASWGSWSGSDGAWWPVVAGSAAAVGGVAALIPGPRTALGVAAVLGVAGGLVLAEAEQGNMSWVVLVTAACATVVAALLVGSRGAVAATPGLAAAVLAATGGLGATAALAQSVAMLT